MSEDLKKKRYERIQGQLNEMFAEVDDPISRMATISSVLHHKIKQYFWNGFFFIKDGELIIGPYQGPTIQMKLKKGEGVCNACAEKKEIINVPKVQDFDGYIECNEDTKSELAIPILDKSGEVVAVMDINNRNENGFDESDIAELDKIAKMVYS